MNGVRKSWCVVDMPLPAFDLRNFETTWGWRRSKGEFVLVLEVGRTILAEGASSGVPIHKGDSILVQSWSVSIL